ncbi:Rhomboid domain-containing protein 1 [Gryllus bimaculatus]|nr:Rhomboid domain-containing protein 1 [Gryllus bimaculatus]
MPRRRNNRGLELGVLLLISEMMNVGITTIPRVTFLTILGQVLLYIGIIKPPWDKWDVCISSEKVLNHREYKRLIFSVFEHGDDMHLYYNMISYMVKGRTLENRYGSSNYTFFLAVISLATSIMYIFLAKCGAFIFDNPFYLQQCAIGFSGVIFALKVVTSGEEPFGNASVGGFVVPTRLAAWLELIMIHILVPGASFMGHLAGILVGVLYCYTPFGYLTDSVISSLTGDCFVHHRSFYKSYQRSQVNGYQNEYYF